MKDKKFLKGFFAGAGTVVAFKSVITLLCILLVSGIFLTVMSGLLAVSDEEKFNRKVAKLYTDGSSVSTELQLDEATKVGKSTVEKVWYIPEKNDYLVQVYGSGRDGKITMWVIVKTDGDTVTGLGTVLVYDKVDSEYAYKISGWNTNISNFAADYVDGIDYKYGTKGDPMYINTGASTSFTAICACVNDAITFMKAYVSGGPIAPSPFENFLYTEFINQDKTTAVLNGDKVTYTVTTYDYGEAPELVIEIVVDSDKKIESFTIKSDNPTDGYDDMFPDMENILKGRDLSYFTEKYGPDMEYAGVIEDKGTDVEITTGASNEDIASKSVYLCMYAGAFATANYDKVLMKEIKYTENIDMSATEWKVDGDKVTYTVTTFGYGEAPELVIEIVVDSDKKVESFTIKNDNPTDGYDDMFPDMENILKGRDLSYFTGKYGPDMEYVAINRDDGTDVITGASNEDIASKSVYLCMYAGAFATANYNIALLTGGGTNE